MVAEVLSPFYFDQLIKQDGLKLAGKLGADFEKVEGSPYHKPNTTNRQGYENK